MQFLYVCATSVPSFPPGILNYAREREKEGERKVSRKKFTRPSESEIRALRTL